MHPLAQFNKPCVDPFHSNSVGLPTVSDCDAAIRDVTLLAVTPDAALEALIDLPLDALFRIDGIDTLRARLRAFDSADVGERRRGALVCPKCNSSGRLKHQFDVETVPCDGCDGVGTL